MRTITDKGGGGGGAVSGGGGGGCTVVTDVGGGGRGGVGWAVVDAVVALDVTDEDDGACVVVTDGGTLLGGVVESGEWPEEGLLGVGGRGGMLGESEEGPAFVVLLVDPAEVEVEEEEGALRLGM